MRVQVSIALATYNGERWLSDQLQSIARQSRLPDELVISDDGSTDATIPIAEDFAHQVPFRVKILRRDRPLGYSKNFETASHHCSGDVVFFCDQDDVWFDNKIEVMLEHFRLTDAALVVHDQIVVDEHLRPQELSMLSRFATVDLDPRLHRKGCATAIRRPLLEASLPVGSGFAFDTWFHDVAEAAGVRHTVPEALMAYRIHGQNTSAFHLNRLEPPQPRGRAVKIAQEVRGRLALELAPASLCEKWAEGHEAVARAAKAYLAEAESAGEPERKHLDDIQAEARQLRRAARRRRESRVWRFVASLLRRGDDWVESTATDR